ncbi:MAG: hypothetical protein ABSG32_02055 [Terriglobia bacterium]
MILASHRDEAPEGKATSLFPRDCPKDLQEFREADVQSKLPSGFPTTLGCFGWLPEGKGFSPA